MKHRRPEPLHPSHVAFEPTLSEPMHPDARRMAAAMSGVGLGWARLSESEREARLAAIPEPSAGELAKYEGAIAEYDRQVAERAAARKRAECLRNLRGMKLPLSAEDETLLVDDINGKAKLAVTAVLAEVRSWLDDSNGKPWLIIGGPVGIGKTIAGAWALVQRSGIYVGARELERLGAALFGDAVADLEEMLESPELLVIDDLGRETDRERVTAILIDLIDYRRGAGRKTLVLSNHPQKSFRAHYSDARLLSRIDQSARFISKDGADLRKGVSK